MSGGDDYIDQVLSAVGFGWWLSPVIVLTVIGYMIPLHQISATLLTVPLPFRCSFPDGAVADLPHLAYTTVQNSTNTTETREEAPQTLWYNNKCLDPASLADNFSVELFSSSSSSVMTLVETWSDTSGLPSCPVVEYDRSTFSSSVVSEFDLVCERSHLRPYFQLTVALGAMIGSLIVGQIADRLGRKRGILVGALLGLPACLGTAFSPWFPLVIFTRLMVGVGGRMVAVSCTTLLMETIPPKYRTAAGMFMGLPYSLATIFFALSGHFVRDWRYLQLICTIPFAALLLIYLTLDESPRWLEQCDRGEEAYKILVRASEYNRSPIPSSLKSYLTKLKEITPNSRQVGAEYRVPLSERLQVCVQQARQYFNSMPMLKIIITTPITWFLMSITYMGITLSVNNFTKTDPFIYVGMLGVLEVVAILVSTPLTHKLGRRVFICSASLAGGLAILTNLAVPAELGWLKWVMVMASYAFAGGAYQALFAYATELYPTVMRTQGTGMCFTACSLGGVVTPFITEILAEQTWWAPEVVFGVTAIGLTFLLPLLPETNLKPLPETIRDVEDRYYHSFHHTTITGPITEKQCNEQLA